MHPPNVLWQQRITFCTTARDKSSKNQRKSTKFDDFALCTYKCVILSIFAQSQRLKERSDSSWRWYQLMAWVWWTCCPAKWLASVQFSAVFIGVPVSIRKQRISTRNSAEKATICCEMLPSMSVVAYVSTGSGTAARNELLCTDTREIIENWQKMMLFCSMYPLWLVIWNKRIKHLRPISVS